MLLEHGLADEVVLLVYPVLLGKEKRIFAEGTPPRSFELASTKALPSGVIINAYKAAGPLRTSPVGLGAVVDGKLCDDNLSSASLLLYQRLPPAEALANFHAGTPALFRAP